MKKPKRCIPIQQVKCPMVAEIIPAEGRHFVRPLAVWLTANQAALLLGCSHEMLYRLADEGRIQFTRPAGRYRKFSLSSVQAYLERSHNIDSAKPGVAIIAEVIQVDGKQIVRPLLQTGSETWLTAQQAAILLECSAPTVYRLGDEGHIRDFWIAERVRRFSLSSVQAHRQRRLDGEEVRRRNELRDRRRQ